MASAMPRTTNGQNGRAPLASSAFLEKKGIGSARRSTPDSEALASSDDDHEQSQSMSMSMHSVKSLPSGPPRRPSWMSEVQSSTKQRKFSLGGVSHASSGSQPTTPSGENGPWDSSGNTARPGTSGSSSYPWNSQLWQKDRPSRLHEVMPSPSGSYHEELRSPTSRDQGPNAGLPFEIPLEPSRKTVRSQSYSAGQLEKLPGFENLPPGTGYNRMKPGLMHRPSRPSMLGDGGRDTLGSLREDEDDLESSNGSERAFQMQAAPARPAVGRGLSATSRTSATSPLPNGGFRFQARSGTFPLSPDSDYAVADDGDENSDNFSEVGRAMARGIVSSTTSSATNIPSVAAAIENRRLEGVKRSQWQTSLGFGIVEEGTQSRRHSFADLPTRTRNNSVSVHPDMMHQGQYNGYNAVPPSLASHLERNEAFQRDSLVEEPSYFSGVEAQRRHHREPQIDDYNPFAVPNVFSRPTKILYLVAFKCNRADIYYIPENTGLQVKAGDTVIVEGDRGQDLGTVEHVNINIEEAKQLKEDYTQKHFRCLMMFSRMYPHIAAIAGDDQAFNNSVNGVGITGSSGSNGGAAPASNFSREAVSQFEPEPRPKMIKRVARPDEVHLLREKEGNEAKAKRVCQTKVNDHGLRMEILDAEFQHDYRKLTFFYYAEEYINFNDLVTDLFKVYKTRIWMSAINPASYTVMNPNNVVRPQHWPRPGHGTQAAAYLRAQEDGRAALENGRTASPIDREGPAARGNREFERMMQMANTSRGNAYPGVLPNNGAAAPSGPPAPEDFSAGMPPLYDPRRNNLPFAPSGQFAAFTHQFSPNGPAAGPWPQTATSMNPQYQFLYSEPRDAASNYSVSPVGAVPPGALNQQAAAFTPRAAVNPNQFAGNTAYPANNDQEVSNMLSEQFQRFAIDSRRQ